MGRLVGKSSARQLGENKWICFGDKGNLGPAAPPRPSQGAGAEADLEELAPKETVWKGAHTACSPSRPQGDLGSLESLLLLLFHIKG